MPDKLFKIKKILLVLKNLAFFMFIMPILNKNGMIIFEGIGIVIPNTAK